MRMSSSPRLTACWRAWASSRLVLSSSSETRRPRSASRSMRISPCLQYRTLADADAIAPKPPAGPFKPYRRLRSPAPQKSKGAKTAPLVLLLVKRVAAVAAAAQVDDVFLEFVRALCPAGAVGALRRIGGALIEIGK